jgi:protein-L-isoaspartate O-methyltransferase
MPTELQLQLVQGGKIIIPIGKDYSQVLTLGVNNGTRLIQRRIFDCTFVPLISSK